MTRAEFAEQLATAITNVFYDHAPLGTKLPYVAYTWDYDNYPADDKAFQRIANVTVTHYHAEYSDGEALKTVFDENDLFWTCDSFYDSDMKVYIDTYTMEVMADE